MAAAALCNTPRVTTNLLIAGFPTLLGFVLGLLSRGKPGRRAEQLYDLAAKMPEHSAIRGRYEQAGEEAAAGALNTMQIPATTRLAVH